MLCMYIFGHIKLGEKKDSVQRLGHDEHYSVCRYRFYFLTKISDHGMFQTGRTRKVEGQMALLLLGQFPAKNFPEAPHRISTYMHLAT